MELAKLEAEAARLMGEHGLTAAGWRFEYTRRKRSLGTCFFMSKRITVSRWHAEHDAEIHVLDTLRHEIAHALAGREAGHGPIWQSWARLLGASPERFAGEEVIAELVRPPASYEGVCPGCKKVFRVYRKPRVLFGWNCKACGVEKGSFIYRKVEKPAAPQPKKSTGKTLFD